MKLQIYKTMKKVPGGFMVIPLILGTIINTLFPHALAIGGFTEELFKKGAQPLLGMLLCCMGAQISFRNIGAPVKKGFISIITKFAIGSVLSITIGKIFGSEGIFGITPMVWMSAFSSINIGLYAALAEQFGDRDDLNAGAIIALSGGAFFTMVALGVSGLADIPVRSMVAVIMPVVVGFVLGNLDEDMRDFLGSGQDALIPFYAFAIGTNMNFYDIFNAGTAGLFLGIAVTLITGIAGFFIHAIFGKKEAVSAAIGNTAGNQLTTPLAVVTADKALKPFLGVATAQIAASIIVTAVLCPLLVKYLDKVIKR